MLHLDPITLPPPMPVQPLSRWKPHTNTINDSIALPDGDSIVSSDEDGRLLVSSLAQTKVVHDLSGYHNGPVNAMVLTPNGRYLITGADDTTVRVWDTSSWEVVHTLQGHSKFVRSVAANDSIIVSAAEEKLVNIWDLESGVCQKQLTGHEEDVWAVAISPDGTRLASSSLDNALWIWDLNEGRVVQRLIEGGDIVVKLGGSLYHSLPNTKGGHESAVKRLIFVDSDTLLSCAEEIIRWDLKEKVSYEVIAKCALYIDDMALHPEDNLLAFVSGSVMVYDYKSGERRYVLSDTDAKQRVLSFLSGGTRIIAGTRDGELLVWPIDTAPPIECGVHSTYVNQCGITTTCDGLVRAVTVDGQNGMRLWNVPDGTMVKATDRYPNISHDLLTFSPNGHTLITSFKENLLVWDTVKGNLQRSLRFSEEKRPKLVSGVLILDEENALVGSKGNLAIWDLTGERAPEVFDGITSDVDTIVTTTDRSFVYTIGSFAPKGADDSILFNNVYHLQCWSIPERKLVWTQPAAKKPNDIIGMSFHFCVVAISPNDRQLVTKSVHVEEHLTVWDALTGNPIRDIPITGDWITAVHFLDDSILLCASQDDTGTYLLWLDIGTGEVTKTLQLANQPPRDIVITEDGTLVVAAFNDEVQLINPQTGEIITRYTTNVKLGTCAVSVDKRYVVAGDNFGRVHLIRISET